MHGRRRRRQVAAATLAVATVTGGVFAPPALGAIDTETSTKPNIILIAADDLGYDQTSLNDGPIRTPNLHRIADEGVRFTDGYVAAPVCTPSRQAIMTGRHPARIGGDSNRLARDHPERLATPSVANILDEAGYTTHAVGKWDLAGFMPRWGGSDVTLPHRAGFDSFYGSLRGMENYCPGKGQVWRNAGGETYENFTNTKYMTHEYTDNAEDFVLNHRDDGDPFFLYLSYTAPHAPIQLPEDCPGRDVSAPTFQGMVEIMDEGIGRVLDALGDQADNTLVAFVSDHGSQFPHFFPTQLRDGKYSLFEGGLRVPLAMRWPAGLGSAPGTYSQIVSTLDLLPTLAAAAGGSASGHPGKNLIPYLVGGQAGAPHDRLHWRYVDDEPKASKQGTVHVAIRSGNYKYLRIVGTDGVVTEHLYDLAQDIGEQHNLVADPAYAAVRDRLVAGHNSWNEHNPLSEDFQHQRPVNQPRGGKPDGFVEYGGTWDQADFDGDGEYRGVADSAGARSIVVASHYQNLVAGAEVRLADRGQAGLVIHDRTAAAASYASTGYQVRLVAPEDPSESARVALFKVVAGQATEVQALNRAVEPGVTYRLRVNVVGDRVAVFVDGRVQFHWTDSQPVQAGSVGLSVVDATAFFDELTASRAA